MSGINSKNKFTAYFIIFQRSFVFVYMYLRILDGITNFDPEEFDHMKQLEEQLTLITDLPVQDPGCKRNM